MKAAVLSFKFIDFALNHTRFERVIKDSYEF